MMATGPTGWSFTTHRDLHVGPPLHTGTYTLVFHHTQGPTRWSSTTHRDLHVGPPLHTGTYTLVLHYTQGPTRWSSTTHRDLHIGPPPHTETQWSCATLWHLVTDQLPFPPPPPPPPLPSPSPSSHSMPGTKKNCLNLGSYNYLGFAENSGPCTEAVKETLKHCGVACCSARGDYGEGRGWGPGVLGTLHYMHCVCGR